MTCNYARPYANCNVLIKTIGLIVRYFILGGQARKLSLNGLSIKKSFSYSTTMTKLFPNIESFYQVFERKSGQWLENVDQTDQTHLVLASGKLALKKIKTTR